MAATDSSSGLGARRGTPPAQPEARTSKKTPTARAGGVRRTWVTSVASVEATWDT